MPVIGFLNGTSPGAAAPFVAALRQHRQQAVGDVSPHIREARRRAALASAVEGGGQKIGDDLFGERRGIDEHRVLPAGFGDKRHTRPGPPGEIEVVPPRGLGRAGEGDPSGARIGGQRRRASPIARMPTESWLCGWLTPLSFQRYGRVSVFDKMRVRW
jgi:hypothetical protein